MRVYKAALAMVSVFLMTASALLFIVPASGGSPAPGAWTDIVSSITVDNGRGYSIDNKTWNMNASIYVYGTLYVNYTFLRFGGSNGDYGIYVYSTGTLHMKQSNISCIDRTVLTPSYPQNHGNKWRFELYGNAYISHTDLSYMWGFDETTSIANTMGGVQIYSDASKTVIIDHVYIYNTFQAGIYVGAPSSTWNTIWNADPIIRWTTISNITGVGLIACGDKVDPDIQNCTVTGCSFKGGNYYYGANGIIKNSTFTKCYNFGFCFDPINAGLSMAIYDSHFDYNFHSGAASRRESNTRFVDCTFNNNRDWGLNIKWVSPVSGGADSSKGTNTVIRCQALYNGKDGIGSNQATGTADIYDSEIAYNTWNGTVGNTPAQVVNLYNCDVHDNIMSGVAFHSSTGTVMGTKIYDNNIAGVKIQSGSVATLMYNEIYNENVGIQTLTQTGGVIDDNDIHDCPIGMDLAQSTPSSVSGNTFTNVNNAIRTTGNDIKFIGNTFNSGNNGLLLTGSKGIYVGQSKFEGILANALEITDKATVTLGNVDFSNNANSIKATHMSTFTMTNTTFSNNALDLELDGASKGTAINTTIPIAKIQIDDSESSFENYHYLDVFVSDNFTGVFIPQPRIVVQDREGNNVTDVLGRLDGWMKDQLIPEYMIKGTIVDNNNPMNITVLKEGYIPFWTGPIDITSHTFKNLSIAFNYRPIWLDPNINLVPPTTHQRRPTLTWNASWDWNSDVINHHIKIYQDMVIDDDAHFVTEADVRQYYVNDDPLQGNINPTYTLTRNLRYNHDFYVVIDTYDPWGLSSSATASFRTVNTRPIAPLIELLPNPASNLQDIYIHFIQNATDADVDPIDDINYLIVFEAMRGGTKVLLQSGSSPILPAELTRENDRITATVRAFDGIEQSDAVVSEVLVINFAPRPLVNYVSVTMTEDQTGVNLVDLASLFVDPDNDDMVFFVEDDYRYLNMEIDSVTGTNTIIPDPNFNGLDFIILSAQDGKLHPNQEWPLVQVNVSVSAVNDPPTLSRVNDLTVKAGKDIMLEGTQGGKLTIVPTASDPDGDEIEFSSTLDEVLLGKVNVTDETFSTKTGKIEFFLTNSVVGVNIFNVSASDSTGATSTVTIKLTVENINDPVTMPKITDPKPGLINLSARGTKITFMADAADDPDLHIPGSTEEIKYLWDFGDGTKVDGRAVDGKLTVEHEYLNPGEYTVELKAWDNMGIEKAYSILIKVDMPDINQEEPPVEDTPLWEYLPWIILAIVVILAILAVLLFVFRKEPIEEIAVSEEKQHEALMAQQQAEALKAQDMLAQIMGTVSSGPALPSAPGMEQREALPAAPIDAQAPMSGEPVPAPYYPEQAPPAYDPMAQQVPQDQQPPSYVPPQ